MVNKRMKFKRKDGVIGFPRVVLRSSAYQDLSGNARALMFALQDVWRPADPDIHYSVRRAAKHLSISINTANNAFKALVDHGFITCVADCNWFNGKARVWRLNWMNNFNKEPTDEWADWER